MRRSMGLVCFEGGSLVEEVQQILLAEALCWLADVEILQP